MKKALSAVLAVVLVLSVCFSVPMIASATDTDPFTYQLNADGKGYTIIDVDNTVTGVVTIPATYTIKDSEGFDTTGVVKPLSEINKANAAAAPVITITEPENGTITATAKTGEEAARDITTGTVVVTNDEIVFTVKPNDGYKVGTFTVSSDPNAKLTGNTYTTTATDDITVAATFVVDQTQTFDVSVTTPTNGEVTADPVKAYVGQEVTLTAEPAEGYKLAGVTVSDIEAEDLTITGNTCKFNMINKAVTVTATFTELPVITFNTTNGTVEATKDGEVITFAEAGTTGITLTAKPDTGYELDGEITVEPASAYVNGVLTIPETGVTVTANFKLVDYEITLDDVLKDVIGLSVTKFTANYNEDVTVKVTTVGDSVVVTGLNVTYGENGKATATAVDGGYKFKMPAADVEVSAVYVDKYNSIDIADADEEYITIKTDATNDKYEYGSTINVETSAPDGYVVKALKVNGENVALTDGKGSFTMPGETATLTIEFQGTALPVTAIAPGAFDGCKGITAFASENDKYVVDNSVVNKDKEVVGGVLFEKVTTTGENPTTTLTLIAFPTAFAGGVADTYDREKTTYTIPNTIPKTVGGLNVTNVAAGAFQAPAEGKDYAVDYVFGFEDLEIADGNAFKTPVHTTGLHVKEDGWDTAEKIEFAANCKYAGTNYVECGVCQVVIETVSVAIVPTAHVPGDFTVDKKQTCTQDGIETADCVLCGATDVKTNTHPKKGHKVAEDQKEIVVPATCKETGKKYYPCANCGAELYYKDGKLVEGYEKITELAAHVVPDENVISEQYYVAPTCEKAGSKTGLCKVCGEKKAEVVLPQLAHKPVKDYIVEKTCTVNGQYYEYCELCGADTKEGIQLDEAKGHKAGDWEVTKVATCSETGLAVIKCTVCNEVIPDTETEKYTRVINALGHTDASYNWETTTAATCTTEGVATGTCKTCDKTTTKAIGKLAHVYSEEWTQDIAPTCTTVGKETRKCACGAKTAERDIDMVPHTLADADKVTPTKEATHFETGTYTGTCTVCKTANVTVDIPKTAHVFTVKNAQNEDVLAAAEPLRATIGEGDDAKTAVDCENDGYVAIYCTIAGCNEYKEGSVVAEGKLGHNVESWTQTKKPECGVPGSKEGTCTRGAKCPDEDKKIIEEVTALEHDYDTTTFITIGDPATCEKDGLKAHVCKRDGCGDYIDETVVPKLEHSYNTAWTQKSPATCLAAEVEVNTCILCNKPQERPGDPKTDHIYTGAEEKTVLVTCSTDGYKYKECQTEGCKEISKYDIVTALGHDTTNNTAQVTAATCSHAGESKTACNRYFVNGVYDKDATAQTAGAEKCDGITETLDPLGHYYEADYSELEKATCEKDGEEARKCVRYGEDGCEATTGNRRIPATKHNFSTEYTVIKGQEPTCTSTGKEALHCTNKDCEYYAPNSVKQVAKVDHTYPTDWEIDKQPTCKENGEGHRYKLCKVCGENGKIEETMQKLDHDISTANVQTEAATCLKDGYTYKACQRVFTTTVDGKTVYTPCDGRVKIDDIKSTGHELDKTEGSGYKKQDPTCTQGGFEEGFCKNCNPTKDETKGKERINEVPAIGHKFSTEATTVQPTCQVEGTVTGTCSVCNTVNAVNDIPVKPHAYGEWTVVKAEIGEKTHVLKRTCTTCVEAAATDSTPALTKAFETKTEDHTSGGWVVDKAATCGTAGSMTDYCAVCDYALDSAVIPATKKHNLKDVKVLSQPECEKVGSKTVECQNENCIEGADGKYTKYTDTVEIEKLGHSYTEWVTSVAPTCESKGYSSSICERCLDTQTKVLIPLGHDLGGWKVDEPAKCDKDGKQHKECSRCDYIEEDVISATGCDFAENTLNTCKNGCGAKIYEYTLVGESTTDIAITKYNGDIKALRIPEKLVDGDKTYNVVAIGDRAFMGTYVPAKAATETTEAVEETFTTKVNTVVIPDSVTSIGAYAFANSGLKIATIPATVTSIGDNAFGYKVEIQLVDAPAANTPATTAEDGEGTTTAPEKVEKLVATRNDEFTTIYGDAKSAAETYVTKHAVKDATNNIAFVALSSVYTFAPDVKENDVTIIAKNADDVYVITDYAKGTPEAPAGSKEEQIKALVKLPAENTANYTTEVVSSIPEITGIYGTGTKVIVKDASNSVIDEVVIAIKGDLNGDGVCDVLDCMKLQLAVNSGLYLEDASKAAGDYATSAEGPAITIDDLNGIVNQACPRDRTPRYSVNVATVEGGTITANPATKILAEATVTLTVAPAEGKQLKAGSLSVKNGDTAIEVTAGATAGTYTFAMPAGDVTVTAEFEAIPAPTPATYAVTVPEATDDGGVTTDKVTAEAGATVTLTAAPATGKKVKALTVKAGETAVEVTAGTGENANKYTFTMPAANVTVTVEFEDATATPAPTTYTVTVGELTGGTIVATPASAAKDATVTLTVTAAEGKQLKAGTLLVKAGDATVTTTAGATADTYTFVMPEANVTVTAEFEDVAVTPAPTPEA